MQITSLSPYHNKPCILLQWPNVNILIDCPVDFTPFLTYLPHVYQSPRIKNLPQARRFDLRYLKELNNRVYVEGIPEVHNVSLDAIQIDTIDAILVSNLESFIALPFYTENTGFKGTIYVTDVIVQFGKLLMEEMIEYFDRIDISTADDKWKDEAICSKFPIPPYINPQEWRKFYTMDDVESCLHRIRTLSYNQEVEIFKINVTAVSSGHSFGSSNWTIKWENGSIAYMSSSSDAASSVKRLDLGPLKSCEHMIVTSMSRLIDMPLHITANNMLNAVEDTLKRGGNVLIPISPVGPIFEIIEAVSGIIDQTAGISLDTPIYFVSPVAKSSLAFASVNAEWMSEERQTKVYMPEEPFNHSKLIKHGRLKLFDSLYGPFSKEYRSPCVVITGHPSLRIGDAAHMIELWGSDAKNTVVIIDPDLPFDEIREPYRNLPIRFVNCPMDLRLDFHQMNTKVLDVVQPRSIIAPVQYTKPMVNGRPELMIRAGSAANSMLHWDSNLTPMVYNEPLLLSKLNKSKKEKDMVKVRLHPDVLSNLDFKTSPLNPSVAVAPIACHLSCYNNDYELVPATKEAPVRPKYFGRLTAPELMEALRRKGMKCLEQRSEEGIQTVKIENPDATIVISGNGTKTKIQASKQDDRVQLMGIIQGLLKPDGSF